MKHFDKYFVEICRKRSFVEIIVKNALFAEFKRFLSIELNRTKVNICWGDNDVRILNIEETAVETEHIKSGRVFWIPTDYIWDQSKLSVGEIAEASSCTDHRLEVNAGDELSVIRKTNRGILAKKNGIVGWYYGKIKNDI